MNQNDYLIEFEYDGNTHWIRNLSMMNLYKGNVLDQDCVQLLIRTYLDVNKLCKESKEVTNIKLFGNDRELIFSLKKFVWL